MPPAFDPDVEPGFAPEPSERPVPDYDTEPEPEDTEQTFAASLESAREEAERLAEAEFQAELEAEEAERRAEAELMAELEAEEAAKSQPAPPPAYSPRPTPPAVEGFQQVSADGTPVAEPARPPVPRPAPPAVEGFQQVSADGTPVQPRPTPPAVPGFQQVSADGTPLARPAQPPAPRPAPPAVPGFQQVAADGSPVSAQERAPVEHTAYEEARGDVSPAPVERSYEANDDGVHPLVEETMARLDDLRELPVSEHAEVFAELHERLQAALVEADAEPGDRG
ncbi:hypothetical protein GCM10009741_66320 [Kribbella lupini]|uniref:Uncharacterized protein n=1 Tax=Kribbella lupini TaxID=291602 RepID=A0ABN2C4X6_9ACTN